MNGKLRKVVHLEVFDFKESPFAYALHTDKNQFGYIVTRDYYYGNDKLFSFESDNVEKEIFYWMTFRINKSQMKTLRKKVDKLLDKGFAYDNDCGNEINVNISGGSTIRYRGENSKEFFNKVLELKR